MKALLSLFLTIFIFAGCDSTYNNTFSENKGAITISMSPGFSSSSSNSVPINSRLVLMSSRQLNPKTVTEKTIYIQDLNGIIYPAEITLSDLSIIINPIIYLKPSTTYEIILTTSIQDLQGLNLSKLTTIAFTTGISIDSTPPTLITTLPIDNTSAYDTDAYSLIYFQFSETLAPIDLDLSMIRVYTGSQPDVNGTLTQSGSLLYFQPDQNLSDSLTYTVELNTSSIQDLSGNRYSSGNILIGFSVKQVDIIPIRTPMLGDNSFSTSSTVHAIESNNELLFTGGDTGLHIIHFNSDTEQFSALSHIDSTLLGSIYNFDINSSTHLIYIGSSKGLFIVDYTQPSAPMVLGSFLTNTPVYGLHNSGDHTFLAGSTSGVYDVNTSLPSAPQLITNFATTGIAYDIQENQGELIVADYNASIKTYDTIGNIVGMDPYLQSHIRQIEPNGVDYYFATGIGGITHWAQNNSTPYFEKQAASYVSKVVNGNGSFIYANISHIGIAIFQLSTPGIKEYLNFSFQTSTFTYFMDTTNTKEYLILVSNTGSLHSMRLP